MPSTRHLFPPSHASVTHALADARPGAVSLTMRRGLSCLCSGRAQCAGREKLFEKESSAMSRQLSAVGPHSDYLDYHDKHDYLDYHDYQK
jgi:hypothetical protein